MLYVCFFGGDSTNAKLIVRADCLWMSGIRFGKTFRNTFFSDLQLLLASEKDTTKKIGE